MIKPFDEMDYHPLSDKLVKILQTKTQNDNPLFFRVIVAYYLALVASQMRCSIKGWAGRGTIPVNVYALALSPSGTGKGHATGLIEEQVINTFRTLFYEHTFPVSAENHCNELAVKRAARTGEDVNVELEKLAKDFHSLGSLLFTFDSASTPAIKQMRQKVLMANAGSINLQIDEIGANFSQSTEALTSYLELYDKGKIKDKLIKSNSDNTRFETIEGYTPANMMMFGTGSKLLDGDKVEELFIEMLEMGYARRCLFSFTEKMNKPQNKDVNDLYADLFNETQDDWLEEVSEEFGKLADMALMNKEVNIPKSSVMYLLAYKLDCEQRATAFTDSQNIQRSEMQHRYFKVLKLSGAYAFVEGANEISVTHLEYAIKLVEDSGEAFGILMKPQRPYEKLARYLANSPEEITLPDLDQDLPYFKGSVSQKDYLIQMATAWGYKNGVVIKKSYSDGVLFLHADAVFETNLDEMIIAYSDGKVAEDFIPHKVSFDKLPRLFQQRNHHWVNHHLKDNYRNEENAIKGFNLLVLDVDKDVSLSTVKLLLKDYKAIYYTTKRHQKIDENGVQHGDRFRVILPMNYTLSMDATDYRKFYDNVISELPFPVDEACGTRSKKWLTYEHTEIHTTDGIMFDVLPFIPETVKNEEREAKSLEQGDLDNLERWVINNTGDGNRNNMLLRFAMILMDADLSYNTIRDRTIELNNKLPDKLSEVELAKSIFHTLANRMVAAGKNI